VVVMMMMMMMMMMMLLPHLDEEPVPLPTRRPG
jgi:quinol-cytochrome oxidoreductase complex cytochrome b subunit